MGEEGAKPQPKIEGGGANSGRGGRRWYKRHQPRLPQNKKALEEYGAPTKGLEKELFTVGRASDAAEYEDVKLKLGRWMGSNYPVGAVMAQQAVENMVRPTLTAPADPADPTNMVQVEKWKEAYKDYKYQVRAWAEAGPKAFQQILQHCHPDMEQKLDASEAYQLMKVNQDPVELLTLIRSFAHKHDEQKGGTMALVGHDAMMYLCLQKPYMTDVEYYKTFKAVRAVVDVHGGRAGFHNGLYEEKLDELKDAAPDPLAPATDAMRQAALDATSGEYLGCLFIMNADNNKYGELKKSLHNAQMFGSDNYPKSVEDALRLMTNHQSTMPMRQRGHQNPGGDGVSFAQPGGKRDMSKVRCYNPECGQMGHMARDCPMNKGKDAKDKEKPGADFFNIDEEAEALEKELEGVGFFNMLDGVSFGQRTTCDRNKVFLDTCCTNHSMFAVEHLEDCYSTGVSLRQHCNAGTNTTDKKGKWHGIEFWANEEGIANLISVPQLEKDGYVLAYHTTKGWMVHTPKGNTILFKRDVGLCGGMPYIELDADPATFIKPTSEVKDGVVMVQTVRGNYEGYTKEQVVKAAEARDAQAMMAHPTDAKMKHLVSSTHAVKNLDITVDAITNAHQIFGPDLAGVKGKTVRKKPGAVRPEYVKIPRGVFERIKNVTLTADVMFVNGLPFLVTSSRHIKLGTIQFLPSRTAKQLCDALSKVLLIYSRGGYTVRTCLMDMEFEKLADKMDSVTINCTAAREHVGDIERFIRYLKERARCIASELPYKTAIPDQIVVHLLKFVCMWINAVPSDSGISKIMSPREIVTGVKMDMKAHAKVRFGSYVEASEDEMITNTIRDRTEECIALGPTGNLQGSIACLNLKTGRVVTRRSFQEMPMPDKVIKKVLAMGKKSKQKRKLHTALQFKNRRQLSFAWDDEAPDVDAALVEQETDGLLAEIPGVSLEADYEDIEDSPAVVGEAGPTAAQEADAVLANANLSIKGMSEQITGVDLSADLPAVTDDEGDDEEEDSEDEGDDDDVGAVEPPNGNDDADDADDEESVVFGSAEDGDEPEGQNDGDGEAEVDDDLEGLVNNTEGLRRSKRIRKKKRPQVIDFDNRTYLEQEGMIHINPAVIKSGRENLKIGGKSVKYLNYGGENRPRFTIPTPKGGPRRVQQEIWPVPSRLSDDVSLEDFDVEDHVVTHIVGVIMAQQYSLKKGLKLFGDTGRVSVTEELTQLHDMKTYTPVHAEDLTREQRRDALASLMFLTQKRDGRVKGRAVADGSKQRGTEGHTEKQSAASPTVITDSVMITSAIDAVEGRHVVTLDIPGAYLHADLDEEVIMALRGELAELMAKVDPKLYRPYVKTTSTGESILYVRMQKAMYGLLRSALLFYLKLRKDLEDFGFKINDYDPCVANKMVNGKQMTVVWHVDDLKVSHEDQLEITKLVVYLQKIYGEGITMNRGKIHDYLGIDLDFSEEKVVKLSMIKHLQKAFDDFPEDIGKSCATPASEHLFEVRDPEETETLGKWLPEEQAQAFHHTVAQLLFVSARVRRDIQTAVGFLTTRVKKPDVDDWGKLKRVLKYLKGTKHMKLTLSVDNLGVIRWWVDASYNAHADCRGQTGAMMSLGKGAVISFSRKQKLNVRSSAEGELVGVDDALPWILWCRYFIEAQGYTVEQNILYQDNKSTILLATNGRWSSGRRTKHIKSRYFYVKNKVDQKEIEIEHMPTEKMWCDVLTKPKQGKGFRVDRSHLMNVPEDYDDEKERLVTSAELLPKVQPITTESSKTLKSMTLKDTKPSGHCRSVLDGDHMTVWNSGASHGRGVTLGRQARVVRARAQNGPTRGRIRGVK